jgi:hypothetical protein
MKKMNLRHTDLHWLQMMKQAVGHLESQGGSGEHRPPMH